MQRARPIRLATACLAFLLLACASEEERIARHLERGHAYQEEEKHAEAIIEFKNVLQLDPNRADAHYGLARSYLATQKLRDGYWELRETVRLDGSNLPARVQYGQLSRLAGELDEALAQADAVLAADPDNLAAHLLRAQTLTGLKRLEEAEQGYRAAVERFPEEGAPLLLLANFYLSEGRSEEAERHFRKLSEVSPGFGSFAALGGFLAQDAARDAEAEAAYRQALERASPEQTSLAHRLLASFYYARERYEESERVLSQALEAHPDDLDLIYVLARFYRARGDEERADRMIEEATRARPDDVRPHLVLSSYRGRQGDLAGALAAAEAALGVDPESLPARLRKAELLLDLGHREGDATRLAEGRAIVDAVLARQPSSPEGLFVRAKVRLADGDAEAAVADLRRALDLRPDWAEGHYLLGSALFLQGDVHAARAEVARALAIDADLVEGRKLLVRIHGQLREDELAIEMGQRVLRQAPDDVPTRVLVAQSLVRQGKLDEARALLEEAPADEPSGEALYARARVHLLQGQPAQARELLLAADERRPHHPEILQSLLEVDARSERLPESVARLEAAVAAEPQSAPLVHLLGMSYAMAGRAADAEGAFRKAIELDPNELAPYQSLAAHLQRSGRREEVLATYERAARARPDSGSLQLVLGSLYEAFGDTRRAREGYERAIRLDPGLAPAKNNLAYLLAEAGENLERAYDLAQEAKALLPESGHAADTLGWVLYKKGIPSAAVSYLKEAEGRFERGDANLAVVRHHLAQAQEANGEPAAARATLERGLADLEAAREARRRETGQETPEPAWVGEMRAMLDRLRAGAAPGPEG